MTQNDDFPMHEDLKYLLDDPEWDISGLFALHEEVPGDLDPEQNVGID